MGINRNLGTDTIIIRGRPDWHIGTINRQGQYVKLIYARKCSCIKNGKADLFCSLCKGKGLRFSFQTDLEVLEENSLHYEDGYIYPNWIPISSVKKVQKHVHDFEGGNIFYDIESQDSSKIKLVDNGLLPKEHEPIKVTYKYSLRGTTVNENSRHSGTSYLLYTLATEVDTTKDDSNPLDIYGDVLSVSRIYNKTQDITYICKRFFKQIIEVESEITSFSIQYIGAGTACTLTINKTTNRLITVCTGAPENDLDVDLTAYPTIADLMDYFDTLEGGYTIVSIGDENYPTLSLKAVSNINIKTAVYNVKLSVPYPLSNDILEVDYTYMLPIKAIVKGVQLKNALEKFSEDIKLGDVTITLNGSFFIGMGDLFTVLSSIEKGQSVIKRGVDTFDELPAFDVTEIIDAIEDEDGNVYTSSNYSLIEYNNIVWIGSTKPAQGKKYTINYLYRPTYQIYKMQNQDINLADKRYPHRAYARLVNKTSVRELEVVST